MCVRECGCVGVRHVGRVGRVGRVGVRRVGRVGRVGVRRLGRVGRVRRLGRVGVRRVGCVIRGMGHGDGDGDGDGAPPLQSPTNPTHLFSVEVPDNTVLVFVDARDHREFPPGAGCLVAWCVFDCVCGVCVCV